MGMLEKFGLLSMPADQYHDNPAVGHSGLLRIMRSPAHFQEYVTNKPTPTPAMEFGTAVHAAVLEANVFAECYVVPPKFDRRTKEGKEEALAWETANKGKTVLTVEQMGAITAMADSVECHVGAAYLLNVGAAELSGFWTDPETGIECKVRLDFLRLVNGRGIVDVKTCIDASSNGFAKQIANFGYDVQAAFYQDGVKVLTGYTIPFYFIAIEKTAPYAVAVYKAGDDVIEVGRSKYQGALQLLKWCRENDTWPAYQPAGEIEEISLPRWAAGFSLED